MVPPPFRAPGFTARIIAGLLCAAVCVTAAAAPVLPADAKTEERIRSWLTGLKTDAERAEKLLSVAGLAEGVAMKLVRIPPGKFLMGSPKSESGRKSHEGPQREVKLRKSFYLGVYEVTQEQYEAVVGDNPSKFKGAKNPVDFVSWHDAVAFCTALSKKTGKTVRLPTEAEWEYACRAGSKTRYCFGNDEESLGDYAWMKGNSGNKTHPVGQKKPNAFGLYDMHGNVREWCRDWYADSYAGAEKVDPQGPSLGKDRVFRSGSWGSPAGNVRSAFRLAYSPARRYDRSGFRVVLSPD